MNFSSYVVLSTLVVAGIIAHAYVAHEQFYPAVVYLSTDKMCLAVMYNFAFALFLLLGKCLLRLFIGTLRDLEVEQLVDSGRGFLADTILFLVFYAPTIDNKEVATVYLIQYICCVIFMKVFHLTTQIRVSHMFEVGVPRLIVNVKLVALMCLLLGCDILALAYFYSVASRFSTFFTWIFFEALTMSTVVLVSICKYSVHMVDLRLENGWPGKSVFLFYIDLVHDVVSMTLFLVFMLTFFVQNPSRLPIYMMADVIQVARKLAQRLRSFRRYRRISTNMEMRFPDATDQEIENNEHCVICRDSLFDGSKPKKLQCNHIFHIDCLRSWFVMQQVCPTCRAEIPADGPIVPLAQPGATPAALPAEPATPEEAAALPPAATSEAAAAQVPAAAAVQSAGVTSAPGGTATAKPSTNGATTPAAAAGHTAPVVPTAVSAVAAAPSAAPSQAQPAVGRADRFLSPPPPVGAVGPVVTAAYATAQLAPQATQFLTPQLGMLPPISEIMDALQRAEEVSKFLREQTDFWMDQVRQITQANTGNVSSAVGGFPTGLQLPVAGGNTSPFLTAGGISAAAKAEVDKTAPVEIVKESTSEGPPGAATPSGNTMADLRRAQQEQWERRRSSADLGSASPSASPEASS